MKPVSVVGEDVAASLIAALSTTPIDGCIVEVGVYKGGTLWHFVKHAQGRMVFGYDTFSGIPFCEEFDQHKVGDFGDTSLEEVAQNVPEAILTKGLFPMSAKHMPGVSFAHIDCDQYRSIMESANYLIPLMLSGGIMWFDDYCLPSGKKAVDELFGPCIHRTEQGKVYVRF